MSWSAPGWDRPSEGTLPVVVPVHEVVARTDDMVLTVDHLRAYSNSFTIELLHLTNPHRSFGRIAHTDRLMGGVGPFPIDEQMPRVRVRFADGRTGSVSTSPGDEDIPKDPEGIPTQPVLGLAHAGGGSKGFRYGIWVFPLPPEGPVEIYVGLPGDQANEAVVEIDSSDIAEAGRRAVVVWS